MKESFTILKHNGMCFQPNRLWKRYANKQVSVGEKSVLWIPATISTVLETPSAILEMLLWRGPVTAFRGDQAFRTPIQAGYLEIPEKMRAENLLDKVPKRSVIRQEFYRQWSDKYELHQIDFAVTPMFGENFHHHRIMDMEIEVRLEPAIQCTDVFPQTRWSDEGLTVGDEFIVRQDAKFTPYAEGCANLPVPGFANTRAGGRGEATTTMSREFFTKVAYKTQIPTIEGRVFGDGFGWRFRGTYERYVPNAKQDLTALLLVPKGTTSANATISFRMGVTDHDRRDASYPSYSHLQYSERKSFGKKVSVEFRHKGILQRLGICN